MFKAAMLKKKRKLFLSYSSNKANKYAGMLIWKLKVETEKQNSKKDLKKYILYKESKKLKSLLDNYILHKQYCK